MSAPYWMVLGRDKPTVRHKTHALAKAEAERLARKEPGVKFVVLKAETEVIQKPIPVETTDLRGSMFAFDMYRDWVTPPPRRYYAPPWAGS